MIDFEYEVDPADARSERADPGVYKIMLEEIEPKTSQNGNQYLVFKYKVIEGLFKGTEVTDNVNLYHPKETVQRIAKQRLYNIAKALNKPDHAKVKMVEFLNKPMKALIENENYTRTLPDENGQMEEKTFTKNIIKRFYKATEEVIYTPKPVRDPNDNPNISKPTKNAEPLPPADDLPF